MAGLKVKQEQKAAYQSKGSEVKEADLQAMEAQLGVFQSKLREFAHKYRREINSNPAFRQQFHEMCTAIGVDPLQSTKGFWTELLGLGSFYYELSVQLVELCYVTRPSNGGLLSLSDATHQLSLRRQHQFSKSYSSKSSSSTTNLSSSPILTIISQDDVERAVQVLQELGNGFRIIKLGTQKMIRSVPQELDTDQQQILTLAQESGHVTLALLEEKLGWQAERSAKGLHQLLVTGFAWLDKTDSQLFYYFPCFFFFSS